ncbi:hypothetical protein Y710_16530 [Gordonia sp. QH-12]|uniref:hypothetical protein n=1 Tax=Gordonia TaxID=2053 RepID=UPI000780D420|nr:MULTISPECIES: hypothetical protein [Gordonia]KXT55946.1 hypothetical protein Y710_16530 [Gordonia sp. QH-12]WFN94144.1 hypothetical protein P5P27_06255 [Gordonia sihwensis]WFN94205.1 hypothetical protein P5P27_06565 [Gordonia sihwensis]
MTTTEDLYQQAIDKYREIRDEHYEWRPLTDPRHLDAGVRAVVDLVLLATRDEPTADGEALAQLVRDVRDGRSHVTIDGVLIAPCDDRGLVEARHAQEPQPWEVLRQAAQVGYDFVGPRPWHEAATSLADRLEAEHRAEQEKKAAAEAEREKLIKEAARTMAAEHNPDTEWDVLTERTKESFIASARALWDANFLSAPESDGGAAA